MSELTKEQQAWVDANPGRCNRCGWPLATLLEAGCVEGNCSMRPLQPLREHDPRLSEMRAILQALERAWSRCPDASLFDLLETFPTTGDAELLKALEKYGGSK